MNVKSSSHLKVASTETEGLTCGGQTAKKVINIQSGLALAGSNPSAMQSSGLIFLNILKHSSAERALFLSPISSLLSSNSTKILRASFLSFLKFGCL